VPLISLQTKERHPARRHTARKAVAFNLALLVLAVIVPIVALSQGQRASDVRALLDSANLRGQGPERVIRFLDEHSISHSPYLEDYPRGGGKRKIIEATVLQARVTFEHILPYRVDIHIELRFDDADRLVDYLIEEKIRSM
jgi:hypothetical protein